MKTDENACSTCKRETESYEFFEVKLGRRKMLKVQFDFRTSNGDLFSCVGNSLEDARTKRDKWLETLKN